MLRNGSESGYCRCLHQLKTKASLKTHKNNNILQTKRMQNIKTSNKGDPVLTFSLPERVTRPLAPHQLRHWLSDELMCRCAAGTNGCMRFSPFPLGGHVSAEWSRCPGSMARRARDSVAPMRRSSAGWMPAKIGRLSAGLGRRHPVTIRKASFVAESKWRIRALRHQTGAG